jgi:hypothetical protein
MKSLSLVLITMLGTTSLLSAAATAPHRLPTLSIRTTRTPPSKSIISAAYRSGAATSRRPRHGHPRYAAAKTGSVDAIIDTASIDFAHDKLNEHVSSPEMLDVVKYPTAEYKGQFVEFNDGAVRRRSWGT